MTRPGLVLASGHMIDAAGREPSRFPADQEDRVSAEIQAVFEGWDIGPGTSLICGGARGADLIAAEQAQALGADVVLCLAQPPADFVERSVALQGSNWTARFESVRGSAAEVLVLADEQPSVTHDIHSATNRWMIDLATARSEDDRDPRVVLVWNGKEGRAGGTRDFARQLGLDGPDEGRIAVIDPTARVYEVRQRPTPIPKRMLALDGGGIRGVVSLEILHELECQLREEYRDPDLKLVDYFDYIGGTSTGAILAASLALGRHTASDLLALYEELGRKVFTKRWLPRWFRSLYRHAPLDQQLSTILGDGRTLGDPELRSLLLLVLHNTKTDSVWPLSNNTAARYNRADRCLRDVPDRNLDLPLTKLVRGSTAAPIYFAPEQLAIGEKDMVFQDGGITPFNNPAMLMYVMATLPAYRLEWRAGADELLIVSVGTGASSAEHPQLKAGQVNALFNLKNLPSVFMNGASAGQDMICRTLGRCRHGPEIDRELGTQVRTDGDAAFTYVRYEADLSERALIALGITDATTRSRVRKLDAVDEMPTLKDIGAHAARDVCVERHFAGFLDPRTPDGGT